MSISTRPVAILLAGFLAGGLVAIAPVSAAPVYHLDAAGLEQTVLRAQMPNSLGAWRQNLYYSTKDSAPVVCWSAKGEAVTLPKAPMSGGVGYEVNQYVTGGVSVFVYPDQASADAALAALKKIDCPDNAKVGEDGPESAMPADQGSDFTSAAHNSYVASITSTQDGVAVTTETRTTQSGLGVVQTEVTVSGTRSGKKWVSRAAAANTRWHAQAVAAFTAFGSGDSR